jgi:CubicO group peptidase (beta-lactamase class C family)
MNDVSPKRVLFVAFAALTVLGHSQPDTSQRRPDAGAFARSLREFREEHGIPGIAAVVLTSESVLNIGVDGVRKLGCLDSIRLGDRFHLGSNAKAMTGFVAGSLVEKGLISWSTRILDVFPAFAEMARDVYRDKTLKDLLSHRARIIPFMSGTDFEGLPAFKGSLAEQREAFTGWLLQQEPADVDMTRGYQYSNAGYAIASAMLEKVSAKPWERLMVDELFEPLGINGEFGWPGYADGNQPWGHCYDADSQRICPVDPHGEYQFPDLCEAAGDVSMSIHDYAVFLQANLLGLNGRDTILKAKTYRFLHTCNDSAMQYSIGWDSGEIGGHKVSLHNGSAGTFYCTAVVFRDKDLALAIMTNAVRPGIDEAVAELSARLLRPYLK